MSFGDPNNPYAQQQGQQPGYGYPQAPPVQPYGGGYPVGPQEMPGSVKAARIMLFVLGGLQAVGAIIMVAAGAWIVDQIQGSSELTSQEADDASAIGMGVMVVMGIIVAAFAAWGILTAAKFKSGGNGIRISAIIYGSVMSLFSLISLLGLNVFALISLALGILVIVFCAKSDASQWFQRPRH